MKNMFKKINYFKLFLLFLSTIIYNSNPLYSIFVYIFNIIIIPYILFTNKIHLNYTDEIFTLIIDRTNLVIYEILIICIYEKYLMPSILISIFSEIMITVISIFSKTNKFIKYIEYYQNKNIIVKTTYFNNNIIFTFQILFHVYLLLNNIYPQIFNNNLYYFLLFGFILQKWQYILKMFIFINYLNEEYFRVTKIEPIININDIL